MNIISDDTDAWIKSSVITDAAADAAALDTIVRAQDASGISAVSGAIGLSSGSSLGLAISYNEINNDVSAYLDNVDLTSGGTLSLEAQSNEEIGAGTVGVAAAICCDAHLAGAGSVSINKITDTTDAHIADTVSAADAVGSSQITSGGAIDVEASDSSQIVSLAGGIALASEGVLSEQPSATT